MNLYLYGRASPVVMVDPNGMQEQEAESFVGQWSAVGKAAYKELQLRTTDKLSDVAPEDRAAWKALRTHSTPDLDAERPVGDPGPDPDTILEEYVVGPFLWTLAGVLGADMGTGPEAEARRAAWAAYDENPGTNEAGEAAALPTRMDPNLEVTLNVAAAMGPGILLKHLGRSGNAGAIVGGAGRSSETVGAISNVGESAVSNTSTTLGQYDAGAAFSGVLNPESGRFLAYPSGATRLSSGATPGNLVPRRGGHLLVERELNALTGAQRGENLGFTAHLEADGSVSVSFLSRSVNGANPSFAGEVVPESMQAQIIEALKAATGRTVRGQ